MICNQGISFRICYSLHLKLSQNTKAVFEDRRTIKLQTKQINLLLLPNQLINQNLKNIKMSLISSVSG